VKLILNFVGTRHFGPAGDLLGGNGNSLLLVCRSGGKNLHALLDLGTDDLSLHHLVRPHAHLVKHILSLGLDLAHLLHCPERCLHRLTVIFHRAVSSLFKLESRVLEIYGHGHSLNVCETNTKTIETSTKDGWAVLSNVDML